MSTLPEPDPHPLKSDTIETRHVRAIFLASLCTDYASSLKVLVGHVLSREDPYRGGNGEALLAITAAREALRTASAISTAISMDQILAEGLESKLSAFRRRHPDLKEARDVIAHVDEYIWSRGRIENQWFDTTNRFEEGGWVFRVGNKLDINMVELASDTTELAESVSVITGAAICIASRLQPADELAKELMQRGILVDLVVDAGTGAIVIRGARK